MTALLVLLTTSLIQTLLTSPGPFWAFGFAVPCLTHEVTPFAPELKIASI